MCTQSERERGREWAVVKKEGRGPCARREGVWRGGQGKEEKSERERARGWAKRERGRKKGRGERGVGGTKKGRNDRGTQRALVLLTGR